MKFKFFNFYYLFFSISLSAAVYPSMMGNYTGYIINLGIGTFILDELILLSSIMLMSFYLLKTKRISNKISGYGTVLLFILSWIAVVFILSVVRVDNSFEIISRDRWIFFNTLVLFMPFIYKLTPDDLTLMFRHFFSWLLILAMLKLSCYLFLGPGLQFSHFGPSFVFMLSLCLAVYLCSSANILSKFIITALVFILSIFSEQMSAIILTVLCIIMPIYFSYFKTIALPSLFFVFLGSFFAYFLITIDLTVIATNFNLNILNFTVIDKLLVYWGMWSEPFKDLSLVDFIIGRGAGYSFNHVGYNEVLEQYTYATHSLAHNLIVTILMKFGFVGLILFFIMIFTIFKPISQKFNFETSFILKLVLLLTLFNFLTTPGIWKIRKGVFLWFMVGMLYLHRRRSKMSNV